jgi:hypothetical protein
MPNEIIVHDSWEKYEAHFKTPTVIKYNDDYSEIKLWGYPALVEKPKALCTSSQCWHMTSYDLYDLHDLS